eukprot:GCRY01004853.1.p1 GENE.GCRY01004853.1~~GCRY01004853.1.p1  ORF type:complete len:647 (-),score=187.80 GCRY01004853.1:37-1977(-)
MENIDAEKEADVSSCEVQESEKTTSENTNQEALWKKYNLRSFSEEDVGLTQYLTTKQEYAGFTGVFKQKFEDFVVKEVGPDGKPASLTSFEIPKVEPETRPVAEHADVRLKELIGELQFESFLAFAQSNRPEENGDSHGAVRPKKRQKGEDGADIPVAIPDPSFSLTIGENTKDNRKLLHECVRALAPHLATVTEGDAVVARKLSGVEKRKVTNPGWPKDQPYVTFTLYKENRDTTDAVNQICRILRTKDKMFGYSGTKDKRGVTTQRMSLKMVRPERLIGANKRLRGVLLGNIAFAKEPLKLGDHSGNFFEIVLRNLDRSEDEIRPGLEHLKQFGFINYFGTQRFGTSSVPNHLVGIELLSGRAANAAELIMAPRLHEDPLNAAMRAAWFESKDPKHCLSLPVRGGMLVEKALLWGYEQSGPTAHLNAIENIPQRVRTMYLHAFQSYIFNQAVSERIVRFGLAVVPGDLVLEEVEAVEGLGRMYMVAKEVTAETVSKYQISDVVLPLPGFDVKYPTHSIGELYRTLLEASGVSPDFRRPQHWLSLPGGYRPIVAVPKGLEWTFVHYDEPHAKLVETDRDRVEGRTLSLPDNGSLLGLRLKFILQNSSYATMCLRELMRIPMTVEFQQTLNPAAACNTADSTVEES